MTGSAGKMELLAPAGNPSAALAAFDAGADAVYCGLHKFNARERSENFTHDELAKIIAYAEKNHRKVYVTFNTLLKESELKEAAAELAHLAECRPAALIVQDLGAARIIREYFPELTLHASTQLGIHNSAGLEAAKKSGFRRVIMERQVTLDELRKMIPDGKPPVEIELFVHGALCCCVSGSCLFSSWLGGWSGNRGKCKQPCRRQYFRYGDSAGRGEFLFSPDDLCALELLDEFRSLGVCSLKIEGRLRRADYVEKVVRAYRTVLDAAPKKRPEALLEAQNILRGVCTRKTSLGFYTVPSMKKLVRLDPLGGSGVPCGKVTGTAPGGFEAVMSGRLHVGDTIRVQTAADAGDGVSQTVLFLESKRRSVMKVLSGDRCFIRSDKKPLRDSLIYRTGESGTDYSGRMAKLPAPKVPLDVKISLSADGLTAAVCTGDQFHIALPSLSPAKKHAVSAEDLIREFSAAASEIFEGGVLSAEVSGEWFLPSSELKEARRQFWNWAELRIPHDLPHRKAAKCLQNFRNAYDAFQPSALELFPDCTAAAENRTADTAAAREISIAGPEDEIILPPIVPEFQLDELKRQIAGLIRRGAKVFRLTSLFQFALFPEPQRHGLILKTMFPFPVCNSECVRVCQELGAAGVQAWIELGRGDHEQLREHSILPLEVYGYGKPCIFTTRAVLLPWQKIRDIRGNRFELTKDGMLTHLYPEQTLSLEDIPEHFSIFRDLRKCSEQETLLTDFNHSRDWA